MMDEGTKERRDEGTRVRFNEDPTEGLLGFAGGIVIVPYFLAMTPEREVIGQVFMDEKQNKWEARWADEACKKRGGYMGQTFDLAVAAVSWLRKEIGDRGKIYELHEVRS